MARTYPIIDGPQSDALRLMELIGTADPGSSLPNLVWLYDVPATTVYYIQTHNGSYPSIALFSDEARTIQIAQTTMIHLTICTLGPVGTYTTEGRMTFVAGTSTHTGKMEFAAVDHHPAILGTIPGVRFTEASTLNGLGAGAIRYTSAGLAWRAPGSNSFGLAVPVPGEGAYTLFDGEDAAKWVGVDVFTSYLQTNTTATVHIADRWNNLYGDVSKEYFDLGYGQSKKLALYNPSRTRLTRVQVWNEVDPSEYDQLEITQGVMTTTPTRSSPRTLRDVKPGELNTFRVNSSPPDFPGVPDMLDHLRFTWAGE